MIYKDAKLLCFSPHPDDVEFGLGGLLNRYRDMVTCYIVVFSDRNSTRGEKHNERDQLRAAELLGVPPENVFFIDQLPGKDKSFQRVAIQYFAQEDHRARIRQVLSHCVKTFEPTVVFVPSVNETMQDHRAVGEEAVRVLRGNYDIYGYEVPKHNRNFRPNAFVELNSGDIQAKVAALNCYSEFTTRYYFDHKALESLAYVRALDAGFLGLVEAFEVYRIFSAQQAHGGRC
ncbi:MAG: PIG-L family deacetylase [Magnetococcales bacterium]|nr:PIG-L family deacetylase [Magnetococcales bacterium]MBF0148978.1 PIG-L family deacetylase [Magnetococcales bacterium]MBF0603044.1 PIG-L family deacetylase [Magnetococcales bacterium]